MGVSSKAESTVVKAMSGVRLIDKKREKDFTQMSGFNETSKQLAKLNSLILVWAHVDE